MTLQYLLKKFEDKNDTFTILKKLRISKFDLLWPNFKYDTNGVKLQEWKIYIIRNQTVDSF
jgi:hypothetical protein